MGMANWAPIRSPPVLAIRAGGMLAHDRVGRHTFSADRQQVIGVGMMELSEQQRKLDASVTPGQAAEYVRKERERNANRDKPISQPDGFINDYD